MSLPLPEATSSNDWVDTLLGESGLILDEGSADGS